MTYNFSFYSCISLALMFELGCYIFFSELKSVKYSANRRKNFFIASFICFLLSLVTTQQILFQMKQTIGLINKN
jgi:hypothetical protein